MQEEVGSPNVAERGELAHFLECMFKLLTAMVVFSTTIAPLQLIKSELSIELIQLR